MDDPAPQDHTVIDLAASPPEADNDARRSLRAQILATEHWSLLASRSTTQSEVLTRITIFLTLVSAGLVTLGILGQVTSFGTTFERAASGVLLFLVIVGGLTQIRVANAMTEDLMYVVAMNRLRAAYTDLDSKVGGYMMASPFDDEAGIRHTYFFLGKRSASHVLGSSGVLIGAVNSVITGLLVGATCLSLGASAPVCVLAGFAAGALVLVITAGAGFRAYRRSISGYVPVNPAPAGR